MTGGELVNWIRENGAEEMEIFCATDEGGLVTWIVPEIKDNAELREDYYAARGLPDGRSVVL